MTSHNDIWESLKANYIAEVEKALSGVSHPRKKEVLADVNSHLEQRFAELGADEQTRQSFEAIIMEMGPATDYAELLEPDGSKGKSSMPLRVCFVCVAVILGVVILGLSLSGVFKKKYIVESQVVDGRMVDKVDYPFVNDRRIIGAWQSVDFVEIIEMFDPAKKSWQGELFLNHLIFNKNGKVAGGMRHWTNGLIISRTGQTASTYEIKKIDGSDYMFYQWKSGDYTFRHDRPSYYVLKRVQIEEVRDKAMYGETADIPATSTIDENGRVVDKIDWPFVEDIYVIGAWKSVDLVGDVEDFHVDTKQWQGDLFLKGLAFGEDGVMNNSRQWTKGLVISSRNKTAARYQIKEIDGDAYMFYEWKSGDYFLRRMKPSYYVLKKVAEDSQP